MNAVRPPFYYRLIMGFLKPVYRVLVHKKSKHLATYQREVGERFGKFYGDINRQNKGIIWCHAVSLGEINTAYPLLKQLLSDGYGLWISSTTQTGFARVQSLFKNELRKEVNHSFVPVDDKMVLTSFLSHVKPIMALFVETELWATTLYELKNRQIPAVMINARLTDKSFAGYQKFSQVSRSMMENLTAIIAQDENSRKNFIKLGADEKKVYLADSLKWSSSHAMSHANTELLAQIHRDWQVDGRPIWVAGSTHIGEDELVLDAHKQLLAEMPNALLILVPRHPERFGDVDNLSKNAGFVTHKRSGDIIQADTEVYLADSMGELLVWYALADVAFVGGSLMDGIGGHNPIEPASLAKPILMGKFVKNCQEIVQVLESVDNLTVVQNSHEMFVSLNELLQNPTLAKTKGLAGKQICTQKSLAADEQYAVLKQFLTTKPEHRSQKNDMGGGA